MAAEAAGNTVTCIGGLHPGPAGESPQSVIGSDPPTHLQWVNAGAESIAAPSLAYLRGCPGAALPPVGAVPVALAVIIVFTENLQIIEVERQMWMSLPRLDVIDVNDSSMLCRSPARHASAAVFLERLIP
jgi:hypothetical protein